MVAASVDAALKQAGERGGGCGYLSKQPRQTSVGKAAQRRSLRWLEVEKKKGEEVGGERGGLQFLPNPSSPFPFSTLCLTK